MTTANKNKEAVKTFFSALEDKHLEKVVSIFSKDARHINPYASELFPEGATGKEAIKNYWAPVFTNFDQMQFPIERLYAMEDPKMVFVKFSGRVKLKNDEGYYENNYYATFEFNDEGHIEEYVEIFNPIVAARGFGMLDQINN